MDMLDIERILRRKGMTQKELAGTLGVTQQSVNAVIRARAMPSERLVARYAAALGVPIDELYNPILQGG